MEHSNGESYEFGPFRLEPGQRLLVKDGAPVGLPPRVYDTLLLLVENRGRLLEKSELMTRLWPDTSVEEVNLARSISEVRKVLENGGNGQKYIETVPKSGYRFVAEVHVSQPSQARKPKWLAYSIAAGGMLLALAGTAIWRQESRRADPVAAIQPLAVLPLRPLNPQSADPYLELGIPDSLITRFSRLQQLAVRPTSSILRYSDGARDSLVAGRELKAQTVLEGTLQKLDGAVRVTVRLLRVADGRALWAGAFEEKNTDLYRLEDGLAEQVAQALATGLTDADKKLLARSPTRRDDAYQLYLKGRYFWSRRTEIDLAKAIELFQQAVAADPRYALAYSGLADASILNAGYTHSTAEMTGGAKTAAERALAIDPSLGEAHATLGLIAMNYDWDWSKASREYRRAIELNPNYATAHHWYSIYLATGGRFDEAVKEAKKAAELDPLSLIISASLGDRLNEARRYEDAANQCRKTLDMDPNFGLAHLCIGIAYVNEGYFKKGIPELQKGMELLPGSPYFLGQLGIAYALSGDRARAREVLSKLKDPSQPYLPAFSIAMVYAGLADKEQTIFWLKRGYEERNEEMIYMKIEPVLDPIRSDPRFQELIRSVGFPR